MALRLSEGLGARAAFVNRLHLHAALRVRMNLRQVELQTCHNKLLLGKFSVNESLRKVFGLFGQCDALLPHAIASLFNLRSPPGSFLIIDWHIGLQG